MKSVTGTRSRYCGNFKYIFATEHLDAQLPVLWESLGVPTTMERRRVAKQWEHVPISSDEILAMHEVDLQLYDDVSAMRSVQVDGEGSFNPYGYEPERYLANVARNLEATQQDRDAQVEYAYRELASQLFLDFDLEAAIARMRHDASHVRHPELLRQLFLRKHEESHKHYSEVQREASRRKAEAYLNGRCTAVGGDA